MFSVQHLPGHSAFDMYSRPFEYSDFNNNNDNDRNNDNTNEHTNNNTNNTNNHNTNNNNDIFGSRPNLDDDRLPDLALVDLIILSLILIITFVLHYRCI